MTMYNDNNQLLNSLLTLPKKRKVFISYHHKDEAYKKAFENMFGDLFINKSVQDGWINEDNSTAYIKRLIQSSDYLADTSVCIVLVGADTWRRKHVDREIYGALHHKVGDRHSGLIGICLPTNPDFGGPWTERNTPLRLVDNIKSTYATYYDWTTNKDTIKNWIEQAYKQREKDILIDNSRTQFSYNR